MTRSRDSNRADRRLVVWGSGGHGRVVFDVAAAMNCFESLAFYDDAGEPGRVVSGVEVITGGVERLRGLGFKELVVAIGLNEVRARCHSEANAAGLEMATCIHPTAWVSPFATIGAGTVVMPRVVVQSGASVGVDCILNTGVLVEHDCLIGDHAHLSPGVVLGGDVSVGMFAHVGTGAIAIPGARIGARATIGAGAVVRGSIPPSVTAVGVPARILGKR